MIRLSFYGLCLGLLVVPNVTAAEPVPQISKPRPSKSKKKAAQERKAHTAIKRTRRARNERARSAPGACSLKPMKAVQRMRIDPQVERLFQKAMTMDGALYPYMRTSLKPCCPKNDAGDCYSQSEAETRHACYESRVPTDFREVTRKMGVKIGAGPYSDTQKSKIERYRSEGRNIRLVRTSNDLDRAVRQDDYGTVLYIQSWD